MKEHETRAVQPGRSKFWINDMEAVLAIVFVLVLLGTINIFSASFVMSENNYGTPYYFLTHHLRNVAVAIVFLVVGCVVDYHKWRRGMLWIVAVTLLALLTVLVIGVEVNGSKRWLNLVILQIQPAECAKLVSIMLMSAYISSSLRQGKPVGLISIQALIIGFMAALIELEPDLGTCLIVMGIPMLMLIVMGLKKEYSLAMIAMGVAVVGLLCILQPYRLMRFKVMFDPWADAQNMGYQTVQSLSAIGSGGFSGMGIGMGISKYEYLPEAHTDFAFAVFSQEWGFMGVVLVLFLFGAFVYYATKISNSAKDAFGQVLAFGIILLIAGQAVFNLLMVGGVGPVVGIPLPFISYGGTSLFVSLFAVGVLINIGRQSLKKISAKRKVMKTNKRNTPRLYLVKK